MGKGESTTGPILVVDDDEGFVELVRSVLEGAGYMTVFVQNGDDAVAAARAAQASLVILEVNLPGRSGYEICRVLRDEYRDRLPIVFLSGERTESCDRVAGFMAGADDYLIKPFAPDELLARVRRLLVRARSAEHPFRLTSRELEILRLLANGARQQEIAHELVISPKTVGTHIEHILTKLSVHSRAHAVAVAYREKLLDTQS